MSIFTDHQIQLVGNAAHFTDGASESHTMQPGDFFDVVGQVAGGIVKVSVEGLDFRTPTFVRRVHPRPPTGDEYETWFNCVRLHVALYSGDGDGALVQQWSTPSGEKRDGEQLFAAQKDAGAFGRPTRWRLRVENRSQKVVTGIGGIGFVRNVHPIQQARVPLRVLNGAFNVAINALAPYASVRRDTVRFGFSPEVADFLKLQGDHPLRERTIDISPLEADGELQSIKAESVPGTTVREAIQGHWQEVDAKIDGLPGLAQGVLRQVNDKWRDDWLGRVKPNFVALHFTFLLSDIDLSLDVVPGWDIDAGSIENVEIHLFIAFEPVVSLFDHVIFFTSAHYEGAVAAANYLGILPGVEPLLNELAPAIAEHVGLVHRYFAEMLVRIAPPFNEYPAIFIDATADASAVLVRWTYDPAGWPDVRDRISEWGFVEDLHTLEALDPGPLGAVPAGFELGDPAALARLDRIDTIVVVMMENRSFDHMLGYLRKDRGENYRGFPDHAGNSYQEEGATHHVKMLPITDFLRGWEVLQIQSDPYHSTDHVKIQVADGAMSGFAQDVLPRGEAQTALTYYTRNELPNFYRLADEYLVCDQWFCAHPGGTYPNRWATLGATMPSLKNIHVDDPLLGFIRDATIFELLTQTGIGWHYYENNVSMIRMYGQYRLDDKNVLPYDDATEGFKAKAMANTLPPVVFVEPRITGVPPLAQASDDHPPASLGVGQQFIRDVYNALAGSPAWERSLLLITYDEHGGFYDHVPPPGTSLGPPEWLDKVEKLRPDGPNFMGPRVPTFVISPFVDKGTVSHEVFDHLSIIKTILVRHRHKLYAGQHERYGPRVAKINHLGAALTRDGARPGDPVLLDPPPLRSLARRTVPLAASSGAPRRRPTEAPADDEEARDFRLSLARAMLPKRR
jgi:phospholipase C